MNKTKKILCSTLAAASMLSMMPSSIKATYIADEGYKTEWVQEGSDWYIKLNDEKFKGWYKDEYKCWYLMDFTTAAMKKGWVAGDSTHWYYFRPSNGQMVTGWQDIDGSRYYFLTTGKYAGAMATGDVEVEGKTLRFNSKGAYVGEVVNGVVTSANRGEPIWSGYENVDKKFAEVLGSIITDDMSELDELRAIYKFVAEYLEFKGGTIPNYDSTDIGKFDSNKRTVPTELELTYNNSYYWRILSDFELKHGVCGDFAHMFNALAAARGFKTTSFGGWGNLGGGHEVSAVWWDNEWKIVDCQVASLSDPISYTTFMISYNEHPGWTIADYYNVKDPNYASVQFDNRNK